MLFREALAAELPANDPKTRHRMIDIVRQLWATTPPEPTDTQLLDYYLSHIDNYYAEPSVGFEQHFFKDASEVPENILQQLQDSTAQAGDRFWMPEHAAVYPESIIRQAFGGAFWNAATASPLNQWTGPVDTGRGRHFIKVTVRLPAAPRPFEEVRQLLVDDWSATARQKALQQRLTQVRRSYKVVDESAPVH